MKKKVDLGIGRRKFSLRDYLPSLKTLFSGKSIFLIFFLILFIVSINLYARFEFIPSKEPSEHVYFEAFYWLVTTATTVGYGDITPDTMEGKILSIIVMVLGVALLGFLLSQLTKSLVASNLGRFFGINRISDSIDYIICGWNDLSRSAYEDINDFKKSIIIISKRRPDFDLSKNTQFMNGDPHDKAVLENANVMKAKNILLCMDSDSEILLAIHIIRQLNPWINITAKMNDPDYIPMAESAGSDQVVAPSAIAGRLLSIVTEQPYVVKWFLNATSTSIYHEKFVEYNVEPKSVFADKTLANVRDLQNVRIIGVESEDGFEKIPGEDYKIKVGDRLIIMIDKSA